MKSDGLNMKRRTFLKAALATGAAVGAGMPIPRFAEAAEEIVEDAEAVRYTFCSVCSANCGMKAYVKNGRLVHVEGNPYDFAAGNPYNPEEGGRLCVKGYNSIRTLYDPDRLKYPLRRTNPNKGINEDPGFERISWEEAIEEAASRFKESIGQYGPESMLIMSRSHDYLNRLRDVIGTPNHIAHQSTCFTTQQAAWAGMVTGSGRPWTHDLENSKYVLTMGFDGMGKAKNPHLQGLSKALQRGAKLVSLDPYRSKTAARAHKWLPIRPGYDLAFALAMINVIVTERLYNREFVENYTEGINELRSHVVSRGYTPDWAAELIDTPGITADTIREIAREFADPANQPAHLAHHKRDAAGPNYVNSSSLAQAQVTLDALVGSIDRPGGMILPRNPKMPKFDALFPIPEELQEQMPEKRRERIDNWEERGPFVGLVNGNFATLPYGILNDDPYPVKTAMVRKYNPLSFPDHLTMVEAFKKLDFVLTFEIYPSEMAWLSDIVLPEPHWYEFSGIGARKYHSLYPQLHLRQQVVPPLYEETRGFGGAIINLAEAMGYGEYFNDTSEGGSGYASGGKQRNMQLQALGSSWAEFNNSSTGVWEPEDPAARELVPAEEFGTPSGKIEFYSTLFEENGYDPLPTWKPRDEDPDEEYPFYMIISRAPMHKMTQSQNNVLALAGYPENSAVMNRARAEEMGISEGDEVYIESRSAGWMDRERKIKLKAKLIEGVRPDTVMIYHGFGRYSSYMTQAYGRGANEGDLIMSVDFKEMKRRNDPGMGAAMQDHVVKIYKA
ncbi:MAG: molybdopterin-dependent oxidoreductase [Bacillota bacterium]